MISIIQGIYIPTINILIKEVSKMCKENIPEDYETFRMNIKKYLYYWL